jgi:glycosyltransferase involved in cell wall biosynthesis
MMRRLVIITEIISPYRIPLFNALKRRSDVDLHVIFLAETDPDLRHWQVYKDEIEFSYEVLPSWRQRIAGRNLLWNFGVTRALRQAHADAILCGGYNYPASWAALVWSLAHRVPFYLWSESHLRELHRDRRPVELLKREFLQRCSGFIVPGQAARQYLLAQGMRAPVIFTAVNAVDNELFASTASTARQNADRLRRDMELPTRYFLFVGRLVREKGVFELLAAYAGLSGSIRQEIGLLFVGDGESLAQLREEASSISPGVVRFTGFSQREELPSYYGLAEALILPTYTDTWGLVVNEAMACALPVIVTQAAGCAPDLVTEGWNGMILPAKNIPSLSSAMQHLALQPDVRVRLGRHSQERIQHFSPAAWSDGIAEMLNSLSRGQ